MDIVIIAQYLRDISDFTNNNSRFVYLAKMLSEGSGNKIEIITSDFNHASKRHFSLVGKLDNIKLTLIHERGYSKNVCLQRFSSHKELSKNLKKYLNDRKKPDIIYCAVPSLDVGYIAAKYCNQNSVKFIVDIQDLWPEAFKMVVSVPLINDIVFYPMERKANYIYSSADKIVAVSDTYKNRGLKVNKKDSEGLTIYLGTDLQELDRKLAKQEITYKKPENTIWIGYLGTMGKSYDIETALVSVRLIQNDYPNLEFILLGDGILMKQFQKKAKDKRVNATFLGRRDYLEAMKILSQCDIALNPIVKRSAATIINKVGDYAALGLPVINSLESSEYKSLLTEYGAGINIESENVDEMTQIIKKLLDNPYICKSLGKSNRKLAEEKFNREKTYRKIIGCIYSATSRVL